jgi:DNA-directed RNA polymerase subunit N (RpoN/RPB10)
MVRQAIEIIRDDVGDVRRISRRELVSIRQTLDELGVARCPLCRGMLVARMSRAGPRFFCACPPKGSLAPRRRRG